MTEDQIQDEIDGMIDFVTFLYDQFGLVARAELSTARRSGSAPTSSGTAPRGRSRRRSKRHGMDYVISPGEGTFYGPKIDLHMTDVLGRSWQMGTIQLDYQMPMQFGLTYMGADNTEHHPVVIHRALLGSLERFIGDPDRALRRGLPLLAGARAGRGSSRSARTTATPPRELAQALREAGFRVDVDDRDETVGKRIRDGELEKIPKVIVYGDRESAESLSVRDRGGEQTRRAWSTSSASLLL